MMSGTFQQDHSGHVFYLRVSWLAREPDCSKVEYVWSLMSKRLRQSMSSSDNPPMGTCMASNNLAGGHPPTQRVKAQPNNNLTDSCSCIF
ncbi:hypothetical protein TNCV_923871 [Trichonephila clavipes]|nr:hypothetical protein TNCV_923871 [Trichonephila clavipes]